MSSSNSSSEPPSHRPYFQIGLITAASIIVAAGIAFYENPHVRHLVDSSRRKIAVALHNLGDEIDTSTQGNNNYRSSDLSRENEERRRARREAIARQNAHNLDRKADGSGRVAKLRADSAKSFDSLVGADGKLKDEKDAKPLNEKQSDNSSLNNYASMVASDFDIDGLRRRGPGLRGFDQGGAFANPFDDEAQVLLDRSLIGVEKDEVPSDIDEKVDIPSEKPDNTTEHQESLIDITQDHVMSDIDSTDEVPASQEETDLTQKPLYQSAMSLNEWAEATTKSLHYPQAYSAAERSTSSPPSPNGTVTPTEGSLSDSLSLAGTNDDNNNEEASQNLSTSPSSSSNQKQVEAADDDSAAAAIIHSETLSDAGFSDLGINTPSSWTDVGSEAGSDDIYHSH